MSALPPSAPLDGSAVITDDTLPPEVEPVAPPTGRLSALRSRSSGSASRHLLTGSSVLVLGAAVQGFGGLAFSIFVSKIDVKSDFGNATALFTSVLFVTYLAGLGLPVALARYAPDRSVDSHVIFSWAVLATIPASLIASGLYLWLVAPNAAHVLWDWNPVGGFVLFGLVVVGSAFSLIFDVRCMTMRRWNLVLARICVVAVAKIALLPLFQQSDQRALWIFLDLAAPVAISGFLGVAFIGKITGGRHRLRPRPASTHAAIRYSAINYVSTLAYQAPYFALPVIVLTNVDSTTNGSFYVAWGIVAIAFYVPSAIGQALLAEGGKGGAHVQTQMRLAMGLAVSLMALGTVVAFFGKGLVIAAFDKSYQEAAHILPAMMLAGIPWAITSLLLTEARVLHRNVATVIITVTLTLSIIVPALILVPEHGHDGGLDGASAAWLLGNIFAAGVAIVVTLISRRVESPTHAIEELDPLAPVI
ncbi:lipopolysaccharide biosynthesis protein [Aquihabitans sp. McL0605]|uniref:lipopolysaccharide biosynthesis protein n=1 Tax=Aquihabitans sp. McL0605 TaxID=3415671 RepID=UPI003CF51078